MGSWFQHKPPNIHGYTWHDNGTNRVGIAITNTLPSTKLQLQIPPTLQQNISTENVLWIKIHQQNGPTLLIANVYIPPNVASNLQLLDQQLSIWPNKYPPILLLLVILMPNIYGVVHHHKLISAHTTEATKWHPSLPITN
jgi:hypothetical protein